MTFLSVPVGFAPSPEAHLPPVQLPRAGRRLHPGPLGSGGMLRAGLVLGWGAGGSRGHAAPLRAPWSSGRHRPLGRCCCSHPETRLLDGAICLHNGRLNQGGRALGMEFMGSGGLFDRNNGFGVRNAPPHLVCGACRTSSPGSKG